MALNDGYTNPRLPDGDLCINNIDTNVSSTQKPAHPTSDVPGALQAFTVAGMGER